MASVGSNKEKLTASMMLHPWETVKENDKNTVHINLSVKLKMKTKMVGVGDVLSLRDCERRRETKLQRQYALHE